MLIEIIYKSLHGDYTYLRILSHISQQTAVHAIVKEIIMIAMLANNMQVYHQNPYMYLDLCDNQSEMEWYLLTI